MIRCIKCGIEKSDSNFYNDKQKPSGKKPRCKPCELTGIDKKRRRAYEKEYWGKRREKRRKQILASLRKNPEKHKAQRKAYLATPEGQAMYRRYTQTRYALRKSAFIEVVDPKLVYDDQGGICYLCLSYVAFEDSHLDHVIPLSIGGKHERENTAVACASCNWEKGAKPLWEVSYQVVQA